MPPSPATRVLVVDDSAVVRGLIGRLIESEPDMEVVATAANGEMALAALARDGADVAVLDIEMPVMDGLTALPRLLTVNPELKVIVASTLSRRNAEIGLKAMQLGAADCLPKPEGSLVTAEAFRHALVDRIRALGGKAAAAPARPEPPLRPASAAAPEVIAIGGSTGAPPVLLDLFQSWRGRLAGQAILVTQHMPPTFTTLLAEQLARAGERPCAEAREGEPILAGRAYIAPGGFHMVVRPEGPHRKLRLTTDPPENFCRPAVDPLFRSVADAYGRSALALVLTGMGCDGAQGARAICEAGGRVAIQDEPTSVVWGMPGAVSRAATVECALPRERIAAYILEAAESRP